MMNMIRYGFCDGESWRTNDDGFLLEMYEKYC